MPARPRPMTHSRLRSGPLPEGATGHDGNSEEEETRNDAADDDTIDGIIGEVYRESSKAKRVSPILFIAPHYH